MTKQFGGRRREMVYDGGVKWLFQIGAEALRESYVSEETRGGGGAGQSLERPMVGDIFELAKRAGLTLDERQRELLGCEGKQVILNCSRQWGKSSMAGLKSLHGAMTRAKSLVVVAAPCERQASELVRKVREFARAAGIEVKGDGQHRASVVLPNGSRILGLPAGEGRIRGYSGVSLLIIDEASRVPDEVYLALRPMLAASDGDLWLLSTPFGKRGFFWEAWESDGDWARFMVPATECERFDKARLERERRETIELAFRQEYLCEFVSDGSEMFDVDLLERALVDGVGLRL